MSLKTLAFIPSGKTPCALIKRQCDLRLRFVLVECNPRRSAQSGDQNVKNIIGVLQNSQRTGIVLRFLLCPACPARSRKPMPRSGKLLESNAFRGAFG
jgi:hypothetical protein